jgi:biopolymer transport protein TolR
MIRTARARKGKGFSEINIAPFTDVVLVLMIVFIVTAPQWSQEKAQKLRLPGTSGGEGAMPATLTVTITKEQAFLLNEQAVPREGLQAAIHQKKVETKAEVLVVRADETVPYGTVYAAMDIGRLEGIAEIWLNGQQVPAPAAPVGK